MEAGTNEIMKTIIAKRLGLYIVNRERGVFDSKRQISPTYLQINNYEIISLKFMRRFFYVQKFQSRITNEMGTKNC